MLKEQLQKQQEELKKSLDRKIREENKSKPKKKPKLLDEYVNVVIPEPKKKLENWKSSLGLEFKDFKPKRSRSKQSKKNLHKCSPEKSPVI